MHHSRITHYLSSFCIFYLIVAMACSPHHTASAIAPAGIRIAHIAARILHGITPAAHANIVLYAKIDGSDSFFPDATGTYVYVATAYYNEEQISGANFEWSIDQSKGVLSTTSGSETVLERAPRGVITLRVDVTYSNLNFVASKAIRVYPRKSAYRRSKPAIWINYADPRTKGDDHDPGATPSFDPQIAVNNVSMTPAVSQRVLPVPLSHGAFDLSLSLMYSPLSVTRTRSEGTDTDTISFTPSHFGHGWSDSLTPSLEFSHNGCSVFDERTAAFSGGNLPSAQFLMQGNTAVAEPLTRADYTLQNSIVFWQSGTTVDLSNVESCTFQHEGSAWSTIYWPTDISDTKGNKLIISYDAIKQEATSYSYGSGFSHTAVRSPLVVSNNRDTISLRYFLSYTNDLVTSVWHYLGDTPLRGTFFEYENRNVVLNNSNNFKWSINLLTRIIHSDGRTTLYNYVDYTPADTIITFPLLSSIITPGGVTNTIVYENWKFKGNADVQKYESETVRVLKANATRTNTYERTDVSYNWPNRTGSATLRTISDTGTTNVKKYALTMSLHNFQFYGVETQNILDDRRQHTYTYSTPRYLYDGMRRYPEGGFHPNYFTEFDYGDFDTLSSVTDPYNNTTTYEYDGPHNRYLISSTDARGVITTNAYDSKGNLVATVQDIDDLHLLTTYAYNIAGQRIQETDPEGRVTRYFYNKSGTPSAPAAYASGEPSTTAVGYLVAMRDPLGRVTTYTYDDLGRKITENAPGTPDHHNGRYTIEYTYDIMDRKVKAMYPDSTYTSNVYNYAGFPARVRDRAGKWTTNTWDVAGRLIRVDYPNGDWVQKQYNGDLLTLLIDGQHNTTTFHYCHEQLTGVEFPDGSTRAAGFDNLGRQIWTVDERGVAVTNAFDARDRLLSAVYLPYSGAQTLNGLFTATAFPQALALTACDTNTIYGGFANQIITHTYDANDNLLTQTDWTGTRTNAYDSLNRPVHLYTAITTTPTHIEYAFDHTYDMVGNITSRLFETPNDYINTSYVYDNLNRLTSVSATPFGSTPLGASYQYDDNGKLFKRTAINNAQTIANIAYRYDSEQRLARKYSPYHNTQYLYDDAQRITWMYETLAGMEQRINYTYDHRDQITQEVPWYVIDDEYFQGPPNYYTYDNAQNRINAVRTGQSHNEDYSYSFANKLTNINIQIGGGNVHNHYYYDLAGNLVTSIVSGVTNLFFYNAQNKLAAIERHETPVKTYAFIYNAKNERIAIGNGTTTLTWRYDAVVGPVTYAEFDANGDLDRWFVRGVGIAEGIGDVIAEVTSSTRHFYLYNHRGDVVTVLPPTGQSSTFRYDAFGRRYEALGPFMPRYTFSTKEYLPGVDVYLYQYRVYDPQAGRWTQRDPIDYADGINLYHFCGNNPINLVDPDGKYALSTTLVNDKFVNDTFAGTTEHTTVLESRLASAKQYNRSIECVEKATYAAYKTGKFLMFFKANATDAMITLGADTIGMEHQLNAMKVARDADELRKLIKGKALDAMVKGVLADISRRAQNPNIERMEERIRQAEKNN